MIGDRNSDGGFDAFTATDFEPRLVDDAVFEVAENLAANAVVGTIPRAAADLQLRFEVTSESRPDLNVDPQTGVISVKSDRNLDYERTRQYFLEVRVWDVNQPEIVDVSHVRVDVTNVNEAPEVARQLADGSAVVGVSFTYNVPAGTFRDPDGDATFVYTFSRADGSLLPAWLTFDGPSRTLAGTPSPVDVSGDNSVNPRDVLLIINHLAATRSGIGEGEAGSPTVGHRTPVDLEYASSTAYPAPPVADFSAAAESEAGSLVNAQGLIVTEQLLVDLVQNRAPAVEPKADLILDIAFTSLAQESQDGELAAVLDLLTAGIAGGSRLP